MDELVSAPARVQGHGERSTAYYIGILVVIVLMAEATTLTGIIFYNALPAMAGSFGPAQLPWVITISFLVGAAIMPLIGKLADLYGSKPVLLTVGLLFLAGSLLAALTSSFLLLMAGRVLQAPALALPGVYYAFFRDVFPRRMVPIAVGMISTGIGVGAVIAPLISGALLSAFSYHSIFWFCFCYMAVLTPIAFFVLPNTGRGQRRRIDVLGAALLTLGVGLLLYAVTQGSAQGWGSAATAIPLAGAVVLFIAFVLVELRTADPMIDLRLLTGPALRTTLAISLTAGVVIGSWGYVIPQMLETPASAGTDYAFGLSAAKVALVTLSAGLAGTVCGPLGGYVARRTSPRLVMIWCCIVLTVAPLLVAFRHDQLWHFVVFGLLEGIGQGFYFAAGPNLIIEAVPADQTGVSGGIQALTSALPGAVMPIVISAILAQNVSHGSGHSVVFSSAGYAYSFLVLAACAAIALVLTIVMRHGRTPATGGSVSH